MIPLGRYLGHGSEPWRLVEAPGGYARVFAAGKWQWDEARVWTAAEVAAKIRAGVWRKVGG